eukprot:gene22603-57329_t
MGRVDRHPSPIVEQLRRQLNLNEGAEMDELKKRNILLVLDSLEECVGDHKLLLWKSLLELGGLTLEEWTKLRVVVKLRNPQLLYNAFVMTMVVEASSSETMAGAATRHEVYLSYCRAQARRRLPRLAPLVDECDVYRVATEDQRIECLLAFCRALATCEYAIDVPLTFMMRAQVHRMMVVEDVSKLQLGPRRWWPAGGAGGTRCMPYRPGAVNAALAAGV